MQYLCKKYSLTETVYSYMEKIGWQLDQPEKLELLYRNTQTRYKITPRRGERYSSMTGCQFFLTFLRNNTSWTDENFKGRALLWDGGVRLCPNWYPSNIWRAPTRSFGVTDIAQLSYNRFFLFKNKSFFYSWIFKLFNNSVQISAKKAS